MKYFQNHKRILIICLVIGFFVAMLTRASLFAFSTDFEYYKFGPIFHPVQQIEFDQTHSGKRIIGMSGFPFQTYSECIISLRGTLPSPACRSQSLLGEFSILFNTLFWGIFFYGIWLLILKIAKSAYNIKC